MGDGGCYKAAVPTLQNQTVGARYGVARSQTARYTPSAMSAEPILPSLTPPAWEDIFGNANPVEVEIGPGKGSFLLAAAHSAPEHNFFGVEFSRRRVYRIKQLIEREQPGNVLALAADIGCVLNTLIRPESVTIFHLYFPDPWWKRRHQRRRLFQGDFCVALTRALVPGGKILIATDVHTYFIEMVRQLEAVTELTRFPWQRDQRNRNGKLILTDFERQFMDAGKPIHYAGFCKTVWKREAMK